MPTSPRTEQMRIISYNGDLKAFIRSLAEQLNLNVIFDRQSFVQPRTIDINLKEVTTSQALDYIFLQEGLFFQKLSRRTILVADQTRRPQYQQLVLRTFYLANSEPEKVKSLVSQAIPASVGRPQTIVVADKDTNSLTVRDTAENVRLIGELIQSIDKDRAEVVMDVNIYEVSKFDLLQFGNQIGDTTSLTTLGGLRSFGTTAGGLARAVAQAGTAAVALPQSFGAALIVPSSALSALQEKNRTRLIASTQVHAFNGEESTARIGQRVPVQTAQAYPFGVQTGTQGTTPGQFNFPTGGFPVINYEPTGLTLKFTPQVFPNQDVQVKMCIESKDVLGAQSATPTFTERLLTGTARVQNNRTMMLASVSTNVESNGRKGLPLLGLIPVLGRMFSTPTKDNRQIDIVIAVTPRVLRAPAVTPRDEEMRPSGTLQSPTTGTLEAMLREVDHEDQLAAARAQKQNAIAKARPATTEPVWTLHTNAESQQATATTPAANPAPVGNTTVAKDATAIVQPLASGFQPSGNDTAAGEESPAFVPAPKSMVSSAAAADVATVNSNLKGDGHATLTSLVKPIESAITPITAAPNASAPKTVQMSVVATDKALKADDTLQVGETRRFAIEVKTGAQLSFAMLALRFDPKVVKIKNITPGNILASQEGKPADGVSQSLDLAGLCLISITNANGLFSASAGNLLFVDVEAIAFGAPGLTLDKGAMHLVAKDAQGVSLDLTPIRATQKQ